MLEEHEFLKQEGRVKVITSCGEEGELKLAKGNVPKTDSKALTTFTVLYDMLQYLGFDLPSAMKVGPSGLPTISLTRHTRRSIHGSMICSLTAVAFALDWRRQIRPATSAPPRIWRVMVIHS